MGKPADAEPAGGLVRGDSYKEAESLEDGKKVVRKVEVKEERLLSLDASRVDVQLDLEPRQKGLLWYSTYKVVFDGKYTFAPTADAGGGHDPHSLSRRAGALRRSRRLSRRRRRSR